MNKLGCLIGMFFTCGVCEAQNLVVNPSFEDTTSCPSLGWFEINLANGWSSFRESPDLWHTCAGFVPNNVSWQSYQYPASGNAYAGLIVETAGSGAFGEYIGGHLTNPLSIGQKYFASLKVVRTSCWSASTSRIGIQFTNIQYSYSSPAPANNFAHVFSNTVITDTANWVTICGSFIADSAYQYFMLGNFFTTGNSVLPPECGSTNEADYFLDDVCVSTDSSFTCNYSFTGVEDVIPSTLLLISPNPFNIELKIQYYGNERMEIILYDIASRKLLQHKFTNSTSINTEQLAKGTYLYEVRNKNGVIKKGKVEKD